MIKSIIISSLLLGGSFGMSHFLVGYSHAGKQYISKHREKRKSLRHGSHYYGHYGTRGFRGGK